VTRDPATQVFEVKFRHELRRPGRRPESRTVTTKMRWIFRYDRAPARPRRVPARRGLRRLRPPPVRLFFGRDRRARPAPGEARQNRARFPVVVSAIQKFSPSLHAPIGSPPTSKDPRGVRSPLQRRRWSSPGW
jgi:hypothetical protein